MCVERERGGKRGERVPYVRVCATNRLLKDSRSITERGREKITSNTGEEERAEERVLTKRGETTWTW